MPREQWTRFVASSARGTGHRSHYWNSDRDGPRHHYEHGIQATPRGRWADESESCPDSAASEDSPTREVVDAEAGAVVQMEQRLENMQTEMRQALQEISDKDHEKFDLIFQILKDIQRRQDSLEETLMSLQAQVATWGETESIQKPLQMPDFQQGEQQQQDGFGGLPYGGFVQMGPHGDMVSVDCNQQAYCAPMIFAMPAGGMPAMSPAFAMQPTVLLSEGSTTASSDMGASMD